MRRHAMSNAYLIAGLGYGDEGKGATVDFICRTRQIALVVRYNGGSQSSHAVVCPDGKVHTFAQFGSGMFVPSVRTHLSRFMLVDPQTMMCEEQCLRDLGITDAFKRTSVDERCVIITPFQRAVNRIQLLVKGGHNSCGMGVGQARADHIFHGDKVLFARDTQEDPKELHRKVRFIQKISQKAVEKFKHYSDSCKEYIEYLYDPDAVGRYLADLIQWQQQVTLVRGMDLRAKNGDDIVFEGAQGVLLDEKHGEPEFNTWTNTTFENAFTLLNESRFQGSIKKIGVTRTYLTRHGDGPFKTEDATLTYPEPHNEDDGSQGKFRRGHFDLSLIKRAIDIVGGIDGVALNHLDVNKNFFTRENSEIEQLAFIRGYGPTANDREWTE